MKFVYVDESGAKGHTDVFVMAGVLIDAYRLRKHTVTFDEMIKTFLAKRYEAEIKRMVGVASLKEALQKLQAAQTRAKD